MRIKQEILDRINTPLGRIRIGLEVGIGDRMVAKHIGKNANDGMLTRMKFLKAISKETGVPVDQLLEEPSDSPVDVNQSSTVA